MPGVNILGDCRGTDSIAEYEYDEFDNPILVYSYNFCTVKDRASLLTSIALSADFSWEYDNENFNGTSHISTQTESLAISVSKTYTPFSGTLSAFTPEDQETQFWQQACVGCCVPCPNLGFSAAVSAENYSTGNYLGTTVNDGTPGGGSVETTNVYGGFHFLDFAITAQDDSTDECDPILDISMVLQVQLYAYPGGSILSWSSATNPVYTKTLSTTVRLSELIGSTFTLSDSDSDSWDTTHPVFLGNRGSWNGSWSFSVTLS